MNELNWWCYGFAFGAFLVGFAFGYGVWLIAPTIACYKKRKAKKEVPE